jgi:hypothetical protein
LVFEGDGLRRRQQVADDDRRRGDAAGIGDKRRIRPLAGAGRAAEPNELAREAEVVAAVGFQQVGPHGREDQLGVFDFEIAGGSRAFDAAVVGGCDP